MGDPNVQVPMNKKKIIPEPERHFSLSTKLMVMAIDLYEDEAPKDFCPYTSFALKKLRQFVDSRKELTAQSYRFFVGHAYNQFFQHEAFHQAARARTKAKGLSAGEFQTSTKLAGYVWIAGEKKVVHVQRDQADDVEMEDEDEDATEEVQDIPKLQVIVKPQEKKDDDRGASSLQREETQPNDGPSEGDDDIVIGIAQIRRPEDRYGQFLVMQLKFEHQLLLKDLCMNSQNILTGDDLEGGSPLRRDEVGYFSLFFFMEYVAKMSVTSFMEVYVPSTQTDISFGTCHDFHLDVRQVITANKHITLDNFENVEEPDLMHTDPNIPLRGREDQSHADPEYKGTVESLSHENNTLFWKQTMMLWLNVQSSG